jgi:hypothetical protein
MTHLSDPLTPARLSEIRARAEETTDGPWTVEEMPETGECRIIREFEFFGDQIEEVVRGGLDRDHAAFIAAARQDVPDLLVEVDRLTAAIVVADKAPHEHKCNSFWHRPGDCTCWKADYNAAKEAQK